MGSTWTLLTAPLEGKKGGGGGGTELRGDLKTQYTQMCFFNGRVSVENVDKLTSKVLKCGSWVYILVLVILSVSCFSHRWVMLAQTTVTSGS